MIPSAVLTELDTDRCLVDRYLTELLAGHPGTGYSAVHEAIQYAVLGGGQRIRPILAIRVARLFGPVDPLAVRCAAAVELLHCASLIVDDLPCMDDSAVRRNQPSVHVRFGEATAILAAFGLVALAARSVVEVECPVSQQKRLASFQLKLLRSLDCSGLIEGQALDLQLAGDRRSRKHIDFLPELKTAPLFQLSVAAGTLLATVNGNEKALLDCFGREFGLAFQLADDLVDGEESAFTRLDDKLITLQAAIAPFGPRASQLAALLTYLYDRAHPSI